MDEETLPALYVYLAECFMDMAPLAGKGLLEKQIDEFTVKITADDPVKNENGWPIEPFKFHIFRDGWLVAVIDPGGGVVITSEVISEDILIEKAKAHKAGAGE